MTDAYNTMPDVLLRRIQNQEKRIRFLEDLVIRLCDNDEEVKYKIEKQRETK